MISREEKWLQRTLIDMQRENMTREERKDQFVRILGQQGRGGITLLQVCKMAGVKKSPYTVNIMADICHAKLARWEWAVTSNKREVRVFFPVTRES